MAYVPVPKDLTRVKTKIALNLTKRQLIFFGLAALVGVPFYLGTRKLIGADIAAIMMVMIMLPFFFLAMYEKDGLPFEKVMGNMIRQKFINPPVRAYKTENFYHEIDSLVKKEGLPDGKEDKKTKATGVASGGRKKKPKRKKKRKG
ncbi:MAG: PrgI family protein [Clostridia bacterium]|nr:PrgI family protein [Lachnospiraceae bacterium]NCB94541.1 PrgI family protein [Clostridia bacterium]